jgi:hypothetical protein
MRTVYYLTHRDSQRRLRYYSTLAGARIAQRSRNSRLGFHTRLERVQIGQLEYERCWDSDSQIVDATWVIEEDTIDLVGLDL